MEGNLFVQLIFCMLAIAVVLGFLALPFVVIGIFITVLSKGKGNKRPTYEDKR